MKNKILIVSTLIVLSLTTAVLANTFIGDITADDTAKLEEQPILRSAETFDSISECNETAQYHNVSVYVAFVEENSFTPEQLKVINNILDKGTTIQSIAEVYDFWLTTIEPFEIVEEICALEDKYFSEYWYENAFNELTDDRYGVLNSDDIDMYKEKGISPDEILTANVLCRKGVYTITEILDMVADGQDIETIACEIYGVDALPEAQSSFEKIKLTEKAKKYKINTLSAENNALDIQSIETVETEHQELISEKTEVELQRLNLDIPRENQEDIEAMYNTGLPAGVLRALENKGFTPAEIALVPEMDTDDIFEAAKMAREALK